MHYCLTLPQVKSLASYCASHLHAPCCIFLQGPLGAGKTTFAQYFIEAHGFKGTIKSPSFSIVESYSFENFNVHHFDLYRIEDPESFYMMGLEELTQAPQAITLLEWPQHGPDLQADLELHFDYNKEDIQSRSLKIKILNKELDCSKIGEFLSNLS